MTETESANQPQTPVSTPSAASTTNQTASSTPSPQETLQSEDRVMFEMAKLRRQLAVKEAETVLAKTESSENEFKVLLLRLYIKYGLNPEKDVIDEQGNINRNVIAKKGS